MRSMKVIARLGANAKPSPLLARPMATAVRVPALMTKNVRFFAAPATATKTDPKMFCFQCEQTENSKGCTTIGVCGKTPETAAMQDLLVHQVKGISQYAHRARELGASDPKLDGRVLEFIFSTLTNVNFDSSRFAAFSKEAQTLRDQAKAMYEAAAKKAGKTPEVLKNQYQTTLTDFSVKALEAEGRKVGVLSKKAKYGDDITGLIELTMYGVKGTAAYAAHAARVGKTDPKIFASLHKIVNGLTNEKPDVPGLLGLALATGELNLQVMGLLETGHISKFGKPTPSPVPRDPVEGKCILISGHDLTDLEELLKATAGKGINVYTHGEMLPAHGYPTLKKYPHFVGHYGGPWQLQQFEFKNFPGAILMTTNCLMEPKKSYKDRLFTTSVTGWPGVKHVEHGNLAPLIAAALAAPGFTKDDLVEKKDQKTFITGFGKDFVLSVAPQVLGAVKSGAIKNFFVVGGCDGSEGERSYYRDLVKSSPPDSVILTLGCGKYRFNDLNLGDIGGIPRVLDMGQCNDSFGAIQVAVALAQNLGCGVNDLPLHFALSWFEQKAVAVLLTLLHLNIQNIHIGPRLPGFATPAMLAVLVEKFKLTPIGDAKKDLDAFLGNK